jgi:hypothetical protein
MFNIPSFIGAKQPAISSGPVYDPDYQAILDFATGQGYALPILTQQVLQNQLLATLKIGGVNSIWNKLDTLAIFAVKTTDESSDFALIDWKRLTVGAIYEPNNGPTYSVNGGFTGNGSTIWIDTNFNPSIGTNQYTQNDASRFFWTPTRGNTGAFEGQTSAGMTGSRNNAAASLTFHAANTTAGSISGFNVDGWHCMNRVSSATLEIYLGNNFTAQSSSLLSTSMSVNNQWILRSAGNYGSHTISIYGMGSAFNSAQNQALYTAIDAYLTAITI